jgi:hypothetical protein
MNAVMKSLRRWFALSITWLCCAASVPANLHLSVTDRSLTFDHNGAVLSTAVICPGFTFDRFGITGPRLSPDNHWVLIDVIGPYTPGNVPRTHALVEVETGALVLAPNFPTYLGVPTALEPLAWASGRRATLAYQNGKFATIHEPLAKRIPALACAPGTALPNGAPSAPRQPSAAPSATPYPF